MDAQKFVDAHVSHGLEKLSIRRREIGVVDRNAITPTCPSLPLGTLTFYLQKKNKKKKHVFFFLRENHYVFHVIEGERILGTSASWTCLKWGCGCVLLHRACAISRRIRRKFKKGDSKPIAGSVWEIAGRFRRFLSETPRCIVFF